MARIVALITAIAVTLPVLGNSLAQDDQPLILYEPRYPDWASLRGIFSTHYWPPPYYPALWRPATSLVLNAVRLLSGDPALSAHFVSLVLYAVLCAAVVHLFLRVASAPAAAAAGVLFAIHPVHTEAVAVAVNQAELATTLLSTLAVTWYVSARTAGVRLSVLTASLIALQWFAAAWKETGILLPVVCAAAELFLLPNTPPLRERLVQLRPLMLAIIASTLAFIAVRTAIVGTLAGTFAAAVFDGLTLRERALTMLGVVPEWTRLFLWPDHLRIDYSLQEFVAATTWGPSQTAGAAILAGCIALFAFGVRRAPPVAFGVLFMAIAIAPVHNVLFPTGILIAERTLLLPSVGLLLVVAVGLDAVFRAGRPATLAAGGGVLLLTLLGGERFVRRLHDWRDHRTIWQQTLLDSPKSWQANQVVGLFAMMDDRFGTGERLLRRSIELRPHAIEARTILADAYRVTGFCPPALPLYQGVLHDYPELPHARIGLIACALWTGDHATARAAALVGTSAAEDSRHFRRLLRIADSALRAKAPPESVRLPAIIASDSARADMVGATNSAERLKLLGTPRQGGLGAP